MKTKLKILSAIALCSVMLGAFAFAGCGGGDGDEANNNNNNNTQQGDNGNGNGNGNGEGEGEGDTVEYLNSTDLGESSGASTVGKTWTELSTKTVGDWDSKGIVFQFVSPLFDLYQSYNLEEGTVGDTISGVQAAVLINLYDDGTAAAFELLKYENEADASAITTWWNEGTKIYTAFFGWWIGGYNGSGAMGNGYALKVVLTSDMAADWVITADNKTPESVAGAYAIEVNAVKEGDSTEMDAPYIYDSNGNVTFRYQYTSRRYLGLKVPGLETEGYLDDTRLPDNARMTSVVNDVQYDRVQKWADAMLGNEDFTPPGDAGSSIK